LTFTRTWKPGPDIDLVIDRAGKSESIKLQLARAPAGTTEPRLGFTADLGDIKGGVLVTGVLANGPAAKAGLKQGDRIVAIGGAAIVDRMAYLDALRTLQPGEDDVLVTVVRNGQQRQLRMTLGEQRKRK
jgi:S1-C subfamily serine protease